MYGQRISIKVGKRLMTPLYVCTLLTPTLSSKTKWYANPTFPPIRRGNRYRSRSNSIRMANNGSEWKDGPCWKKCTVIGLNWSNEMYDILGPDPTQPNKTKPNETQHIHRKNVHLLRGVCTRRVFRHKTRNFFVFRIFLHSPHPKSVKRIEALWKKKDKINRLLLSIYK